MLEVHRCRQIEWSPSAVVALATSVNGAAVAVARENGAIEIWSVAAGSLGWHCQLVRVWHSVCLRQILRLGFVNCAIAQLRCFATTFDAIQEGGARILLLVLKPKTLGLTDFISKTLGRAYFRV